MIRILDWETIRPEEILNRDIRAEADVGAAVDAVIADVRKNGDAALLRYTERFDGVSLTALEVTAAEMDAAWAALTRTSRPRCKWRRTTSAFSGNGRHNDFVHHRPARHRHGPAVHPYPAGGRVRDPEPGGLPLHHFDERDPRPHCWGGGDLRGDPAGPDRRRQRGGPGGGEDRRGGPDLQGGRRPGGGGSGLRHGDHPGGGQGGGSRRHLRGHRQAQGVRPGGHRHDRRAQRDPGALRWRQRPRLGGGGPAEPGGARRVRLRRAGDGQPPPGPGGSAEGWRSSSRPCPGGTSPQKRSTTTARSS